VELRTFELLTPVIGHLTNPIVIAIGVGHGDIYEWLWREPGAIRIGIDINHEVMVKALTERGRDYYYAVEGDALRLPFPDHSADIVVFDFVLHHLIGQGRLESFLAEGSRVLRAGGFMISREPSSYSPGGLALNALNYFGLMHKLTGASSQEFALSPPILIKMFEAHGQVMVVEGLTYLFSHRLPPRIQDVITTLEPYLFHGARSRWLADFLLYVVRKLN
jgi:ubiquinone/menaquinone biosynthesis C-methylase UbiE